ncbi:PepSY domain-containing protein [Acidaminobacter hydrogenoformans]|uniref:Peptidase propeptide and YPEB domain-containing protein n=1 Tax=Acidaminobacter hydrogenoformans DSM 2784 TaxID=1120920 RepID=A0A1G5RY80_9FIRM|nr:PepSY domain-containing protein [Acidaminobacter hydrogenoformans]SCZ79013.1 Peptidase propeptide and YPEB domain-containing protein [Acidaminobacter hydrogenoformans DSM 2784]
MTIKRKLSLLAIPGLLAASAFTFAFLNAPANTLTVDVNPSIELTTNRLDKVVEINPLNNDARSLLEGYTPSDRDLDDVVNDLVDRMILTGYITGGQDNVVMISVQDEAADQKLVDRVNKAIAAYLENKQIEATIVNKKLDIAREALNKDGVSSGKLAVVEALMNSDDSLSKEALADMKISELVALAKDLNIKPSTLFEAVLDRDDDFDDFDLDDDFDDDAYKDADDKDDQDDDRDDVWDDDQDDRDDRDDNWEKSDKPADDSSSASIKVTISDNVISAERARTIALQKVNGEIIKLALDDDDDRMEYEVEILSNGIKYEMEIDAVTGSILEFESEAVFDDDKAWDDDNDYDDVDQDLPNDREYDRDDDDEDDDDDDDDEDDDEDDDDKDDDRDDD